MSIQNGLQMVSAPVPEVLRATVPGGMTRLESSADECRKGHCVTEQAGLLPCWAWFGSNKDLGGEVGMFGDDGVGNEEAGKDQVDSS